MPAALATRGPSTTSTAQGACAVTWDDTEPSRLQADVRAAPVDVVPARLPTTSTVGEWEVAQDTVGGEQRDVR